MKASAEECGSLGKSEVCSKPLDLDLPNALSFVLSVVSAAQRVAAVGGDK